MLDFYKYEPQFGKRDASPFCLKLMAYLKLADIAHNTHEIMDPRKAPKQKLPFIVDKGKDIADSELIIAYLKETYGDPLGEGLSDTDKAITHAFNVMFAERYYWTLVHTRWILPTYQPLMTETWFGMIPKPLRGFITKSIFKQVKKNAVGHGIGRHSTEEIYAMGLSDLKAVEAQLGDKDFLLGDTPREIDATAYAFLENTRGDVFDSPVTDYVNNSPKLMAYIDRVDKAAFG